MVKVEEVEVSVVCVSVSSVCTYGRGGGGSVWCICSAVCVVCVLYAVYVEGGGSSGIGREIGWEFVWLRGYEAIPALCLSPSLSLSRSLSLSLSLSLISPSPHCSVTVRANSSVSPASLF